MFRRRAGSTRLPLKSRFKLLTDLRTLRMHRICFNAIGSLCMYLLDTPINESIELFRRSPTLRMHTVCLPVPVCRVFAGEYLYYSECFDCLVFA